MHLSQKAIAFIICACTALGFTLQADAQCTVDAGDNISICAGESVTLGGSPTIVAAGDNAVVTWNNGAADVTNPTVSPSVTTTYTVTLTSDGGCQTTDQVTVIVNQGPNAAFSFNPSGACSSSPVQFINNSSGSGLSFSWNFGNAAAGDANTSTANNPSHQFIAPGNGNQSFNVTLTVTDANGCQASATESVPVIQSPDASLTDADIFTPFVMCGTSGQNTFDLTVSNTSSTTSTNVNYTLDWGDGSPVISGTDIDTESHTYVGTGFFDLTFTVEGANGCITTEVYEVFAGSNPSVGLASPGSTINLCAPNELVFPITNWEMNSDGTIYTVTFSDGSPAETFIHPPPSTISHIFETSSCDNTSIGGFENSFDVRIIAENPCGFSAATIEPIQTSSAPTADVSVFPGEEGCADAPFTFTNSSTNANFNNNGTCVSLMTADWTIEPATGWSLTAGSLSDPDSFSAIFEPGEYTVTMVGANPCGSDEFSIDICVTTPPEALYTADPLSGCAPLLVPTNNLSSSLNNCDNETYLWEVTPGQGWSFASGDQTAVNPTFNFFEAGSYTVELTIENDCGIDTHVETIVVFEPPTVEIADIPNGCEGITFTPSATYDDGGTPITDYDWSFPSGDPASSNQASPGAVSYNATGTYTVTVSATNLCGTTSDSQSFLIESAPNVVVVPVNPEICFGETVELNASGAVSYVWSPAGGLNTTVGPIVEAAPGSTATFEVTGTSAAGCIASTEVTVDVNPLPSLTPGGPYEICADECVDLEVTPSGGTAPYQSFNWTPAVGLSATDSPAPTACLNSSQSYEVSVTDANGCQALATVPVTVNPLPVVNTGDDLTLCNQPVGEQLSGFSPTGGTWSGANVTADGLFTPSGLGSFELTYTFTDANGCENADDMIVEVIDPVAVDAGPDLAFCAESGDQQLTAATPGGVWSGSGVTPDGIFTPSAAGVIELTYSVGGGSCLTVDVIEVEVYPLPEPDAGEDLVICQGDQAQLSGSVSGGTEPYLSVAWLSAPGLSDNSVLDPMVQPEQSESYTLFVTDANGCEAGDEVFVEVLPAPTVDAGSDLTLCNQPIPEQLTGFSPVGGEWTGSSVTTDGVFTPFTDGVFELTYSFTNAQGCSNEASITVSVIDAEEADAGDDFAVCVGADPVTVSTSGVWSGDFVTETGVFSPSEVGEYELTLTIGVGTCETSDALIVTVNALPTVDVGEDVTICEGGTAELLVVASSTNGAVTDFLWEGPSLANSDTEATTASPEETSTYTVTVADAAGCENDASITVNVSPLPEVTAGESLTLCDQPIAETLEGFFPGVDVPNGTGAWSGQGIVDPSGIFESPGVGVYELTYTFTDNGGCSDSDIITVTVVEPVVADAGSNQSICLNNGVFVLDGFTPATNGSWSGIGIIEEQGVFDPSVSGVGIFELTLEFGSGTCFTSDQMTVEVLGLPELTVPENPVFCGNDGISDLGLFSPTGGFWEGTGISDASAGTFDPSGGEGTYEVFYTYTDPATGCADTLDVSVAVSPVPEAAFSVPDQGCTNAALDLANTSQGASSFDWEFGDGSGSTIETPDFTYQEEGVYTVTLTVTNTFGCVDEFSLENEIVNPPTALLNLSALEGCAPLEVQFENNSVGQYTSFEWDLAVASSNEELPPPVVFEQEDDDVEYTVTLTATNYCGVDVASETVTVFPQPIASFGTDFDAFCSPWSAQFNNTSVGNPEVFFWDFGDGNTSILEQPGENTYFTEDEPTDYTITLTVSNNCGTDDFDYTITVLPNTVTAFFNTSITAGCQPLTVDFTDFSTGGNVVSYDFGDGNVSNLLNPSHTFTDPGIYDIAQFVNNGCSFDTTFAQIEVFEAPEADFVANVAGACAGTSVEFTNLSDNVNNVNWDFGDGNTSNVTNPSHVFQTAGTFDVTIEVASSGFECPGTFTQPFTVYELPEPSFSFPDEVACSPHEVVFTNTSTGASFYTWDFGNGETSSNVNTSQVFTNSTGEPILYTVTLTATTLQLCEASFSSDIIVAPTPVADFTLSQNEACTLPVTIQLQNNSLFATSYSWDLGVLGTSELVNPTVQVEATGDYPITLTAINTFGCSANTSDVFTVNPLPQIGFTADAEDGCAPLTVNFTNTSQGGVSFQWFFGGGGSSTAENPTVTFPNPGLFDVGVVVETDQGCTDTLVVDGQVTVYPLPVASFTQDPSDRTTIFNPTVSFTDQSIDASSYFWSFGDGNASQEANPVHTYDIPGTFFIQLTVENIYGCLAEATSSIVVLDQFNVYVPNAFTPDGDNVNDVFLPKVVGRDLLESYQLAIFDRWGIEVFKSDDIDEPWQGNFRGGEYYVQDDAYIWQIKYKLKGADKGEVMTGHVFQLR